MRFHERARRIALLTGCLVVAVFKPAPAQIDSLEVGDRVRLMTERSLNPNTWQDGKIATIDRGGLSIVGGRRVPLETRFDQISRLQLSVGTNRRRGFKYLTTGAALGFVVGAGLTLLSSNANSGDTNDWIDSGLAGTIIGGTAGGIIGFTSEEWSEIHLDQEPIRDADENR